MKKNFNFALALFLHLLLVVPAGAVQVFPVLEFPEAGMDDPARYKEYTTRFYRDSSKNAVQIYLNRSTGRVVSLWADSANESLSFTARDASGKPVSLQWCSKDADATETKNARFLQFSLCTTASGIEVGHFLLGSMRKERDFQYFKKDLQPFNSEPFHEPELLQLIANLEELPAKDRAEHLKMLETTTTQELRSRMLPGVKQNDSGVSVEQVSFDGKNHLWLELTSATAQIQPKGNMLSIQSKDPIKLKVKIGTDAAPLTPLDRNEIFNEAFLKFYTDLEKHTSKDAQLDFRWLDREVRGMELVCYQEKLMAGIPNFATYFGRDTMMSAFMFEPIWSVSMREHALGSVLRKLSERGAVSHEEALGGQAIRENAGEYNRIIEEYLQERKDTVLLNEAQNILEELNRVRENYKMVDDDFQLPVLVGRYIADPQIPTERKRAYLAPRLGLILKNFAYVSELTAPYVQQPDPLHLVGFPKLEDGRWMSASWRDSGPGYAGGRFAMDVNALWVPRALQAIADTLQFLQKAGYSNEKLESLLIDLSTTNRHHLVSYIRNRRMLQDAIRAWQDSRRHFWVRIEREEALRQIQSKLESLPDQEETYWGKIVARKDLLPNQLEFLTLSLDENGKPIPVLNSDTAALLFIEQDAKPGDLLKLIASLLLPYPAGVFVENLGPLCANDAYASPTVWKNFEEDRYHSPRVVWGREVNLLTLGLLKQIEQAQDPSYQKSLQDTLGKIRQAVEASQLKHNELWSYEIHDGKLLPVRYGTSSDIQLWNLTDLSIQFFLERMSGQGDRSAIK